MWKQRSGLEARLERSPRSLLPSFSPSFDFDCAINAMDEMEEPKLLV